MEAILSELAGQMTVIHQLDIDAIRKPAHLKHLPGVFIAPRKSLICRHPAAVIPRCVHAYLQIRPSRCRFPKHARPAFNLNFWQSRSYFAICAASSVWPERLKIGARIRHRPGRGTVYKNRFPGHSARGCCAKRHCL